MERVARGLHHLYLLVALPSLLTGRFVFWGWLCLARPLTPLG